MDPEQFKAQQAQSSAAVPPSKKNNKGLIASVLVIVVVAIALGLWMHFRTPAAPAGTAPVTATNPAPKSPYADDSFSFSTTITGKTCAMNVCKGTGDKQCVPLSGTVDAKGSCKLDKKQSTPEAQALLNIVAPN